MYFLCFQVIFIMHPFPMSMVNLGRRQASMCNIFQLITKHSSFSYPAYSSVSPFLYCAINIRRIVVFYSKSNQLQFPLCTAPPLTTQALLSISVFNIIKKKKAGQYCFASDATIAKGQLMSKCPFGVFKSTKKTTNFL